MQFSTPLCPHFSPAPALTLLSKLFETRTDGIPVFLKILFVYRPAFSFLNTYELEMEKQKLKATAVHSSMCYIRVNRGNKHLSSFLST